MSGLLNRLKKSLICFVALATSASMLAPVSALATETTSEVGVDNHTQGREDAKIVSGITIGDVKAPKEGERLDDKAVVTTAEGETWEIPVIWIGEDLKPDTGLAGKGSYLPVLAYIVPEQYTVRNNDAAGRGYKITLSEDLLKLFGENKIISIYENKTGITYILPAKLKDLYAQKGTVKNPTDAGGNEIVPADQVAPYEEEAEEEPAQEETGKPTPEEEEKPAQEEETPQKEETPQEDETPQEEEQTGYTHIVNVHCNQNAKDALTESDLDFLAELVVNTLQPQAVDLLTKKFPAFQKAAENGEIGKYITVIVSYEEGSTTVGYASRGRTTDETYPDRKFVYSLTVNANPLTDHKEDGKAILTRDFSSVAITDLANTVVHELFHCFSYDYNRPGLTGYLLVGDEVVDLSESGKVQFPIWFVEGTASTVENNWQYRQTALRLLRTPDRAEVPLEDFSKDILVQGYVDGRYKNENGSLAYYNFDIQYCNGVDKNGQSCSEAPSRYVSGYLACMYLYELAAGSDPEIGSSRSISDDRVVISSEKLRLGMNSIIERMHNGETLDQVINSISGGNYKDTADFEARFIKGTKDEDGKYSLSGDAASLDYVCDFMNYMNEIDKREGKDRTYGANGSVLFDFETDFGSPLSFEGTYPASVLQPLDDENEEFQRWARSTVSDRSASSTGGLSLSGKSDSTKDTVANILAFTSPSAEESSEETSVTQEAAKESNGAATAVTAEAIEATETTETTEVSAEAATATAAEAAPASDTNAATEAPESASEGSSTASSVAVPVTEEAAPAPAPEAAPVEVAAPSTAIAAEPVESEDAPAAEEAIAEEASAEAVTTSAE
ncbi:MAG: hypothetical protein IJ198_08195 [Lachnospiraceae bacterium]|nr:hypothetical protein [Lachnospiraceae bacterium]